MRAVEADHNQTTVHGLQKEKRKSANSYLRKRYTGARYQLSPSVAVLLGVKREIGRRKVLADTGDFLWPGLCIIKSASWLPRNFATLSDSPCSWHPPKCSGRKGVKDPIRFPGQFNSIHRIVGSVLEQGQS